MMATVPARHASGGRGANIQRFDPVHLPPLVGVVRQRRPRDTKSPKRVIWKNLWNRRPPFEASQGYSPDIALATSCSEPWLVKP